MSKYIKNILNKMAMNIDDVIALSSIGRTKIYQEIREGRLKAIKCGRRTIFLKKDVESWLNSLPNFVQQDAC